MGLTLITNNSTLRVVHNVYEAPSKRAMTIVHKKVDRPVIQLITM